MSKTERKLSAVSLVLIAVLVFTALFNLAYVGNVASAVGGNVAPSSVSNNFVKSDMNFDSIREQYLNYELVQKNTASYDGDRWVIVALEGATLYDKYKASSRYNDFSAYSASVEGQKAQKSLQIAQSEFLSKLDRHGIDYEFKYSYTAINNAVAVKVNAEAFNAIKKMNGVEDVYYVEYYDVPKVAVAVENNANVYTTGIYNSDGLGYKGEGMVVAVLDTGLDRTHEAFQADPTDPAWDKEYVESVVASGRLKAEGTADDFYYSSKVPFAYDYADDDPNVYPSYSSHGTHVAGIVAGKSDYVVNKETGETFVGVAPEAQLVICKVFTDDFDSEALGGANTMGILAALNDCTQLGVDVINMSLGSSAGFADEKSDEYINSIYQAIEDEGISLVVAASNDYSSGFGGGNGTNLASNPDSGTVGSPSTYHSALSVASINGQKSSYIMASRTNAQNLDDAPVAFITNSSNEYGQEFKFIDQLYEKANANRAKRGAAPAVKGDELKFKFVVIPGIGAGNNYSQAAKTQLANKTGYDGTIALVKRGTNTFAEKVQAAMITEADAVIIYNNVAGTIRMSLGEIDDPIPTCSISMDAGKAFISLASGNVGTIIVNSSFEAGPFMSEFSSWGPMPDLELKPEITAHGGEITSAVAGGYDKYSGTSMAAPNMAGAVAILRQYLKDTNSDLTGKALNERVNQVLMSTATIAKNDEGNPYSPRKQGAGLAGIADAIHTESYLTVISDGRAKGETKGDIRSKTKIELYDDPNKNGEYVLDFTINNIKSNPLTYVPVTHVMTETMSSDNKTVAEKAYMLTDLCQITYKVGADANSLADLNGDIVVQPNSTLAVRVTIKLGEQARKYLDANFVNGMYVEGFVSLQPKQGDEFTTVTVGLPYLAFYGDWTAAPLFDYDEYEIGEYKKEHPDAELGDPNLPVASAGATVPIGRYWGDKYIVPLGTYLYTQDENEVEIYPDKQKICVSMWDDERGHSIYELYMLYAGLLRGAAYMDVVITDDATGEVIYEDQLENVRKSFSGGGSNRGAPVDIELNPRDWGLQNNSRYTVSVKGQLDYEGGENPNKNTYEFPVTIDYEDPEMISYRIRYMTYTENKELKYRIYMDIDVCDNQFVSCVYPCYLTDRPNGLGGTEKVLNLVTKYPIPVNGQRGETSTVSFEITDIYEEYVKTGNLFIQVEDYALNSQNYNIVPGRAQGEDAMNDPEFVHFAEDEYLTRSKIVSQDKLGTPYYNYNMKIPANTLYKFNLEGGEDVSILKSLTWLNTDARVQAQGEELYTGLAGRKTITLTNTTTTEANRRTYAIINITIGASQNSAPVLTGIKLGSALDGDGVAVSLNAGGTLELNPNQTLKLTWTPIPWYCPTPNVTWKSNNEKVVTVDQEGNIKAITRGVTSVVVTAETAPGNPRVSKTVRISVGKDYDVRNYTLYDYYGTGEIEIPSNLNIMYLDEHCFKGNTQIKKVILPTSLTEIPEYAFQGCTALKEIVIPGQCIAIKERAFEGCTSLETITLGKFVDSNRDEIKDPNGNSYGGTLTIGRRAFKDCTSLVEIENQDRLTTLYEGAFEGCTSLEAIDISELRVTQNSVFKGCTKLTNVTTSKDTALARNMFEGCTALTSFTFKANAVPSEMFLDCENLANVTFENELTSIALNAFAKTAIKNIKLPNGNITLSADAFKGSSVETLTLSAGTSLVFARNTAFDECASFTAYAIDGNSANYEVEDGVLYNKDKTELIAVPFAKTLFTMPSTVKSIANGALSGVNVTSIDLSEVENIGNYAFAGNKVITSVTLPSGLTSIPEGLFDGCSALESVTAGDNFASVVTIGNNAFRGCTKLASLSMPNVTKVGANAFRTSGLSALPSVKIVEIGESAFESSKLANITLEQLTKVGASAFANIDTLRTAILGPIIDMGASLFTGSAKLNFVSFAEGTTEIAYRAFYNKMENQTQMTVTIPSTVEYIGQFAFYNQVGLTEIDLSHVSYVDAMAFCYTSISNVDLSNILQIGSGAFGYTAIVQANLANSELVASEAFFGVSTLTSVTFGALERIGENAFYGTSITTVTLPETFDNRTHSFEWETKDEKGNVEDIKSREELNYTAGAFTGATLLTEINMANGGNDVFFSEDGVLYSRVENGYVLEQYPSAKEGDDYTIKDGTVIIQNGAFMSVSKLKNVVAPYTVKVVGSNAFLNSSVKNYTFNSVEAPILLTTYFTEYDVADEYLQSAFSRGPTQSDFALTNFYANFYDFAIWADPGVWTDAFIEEYGHFGLTLNIPLNSKGYGKIWQLFFDTINYTAEIMPEDVTYKAIEAINALLPYVDKVDTLSLDDISGDGLVAKLAAEARVAYNNITSPAQRLLAAEKLETLTSFEKALRDRKAEITGTPVKIARLVTSKEPDKYRYVEGDNFDPTGMELTAVYEDGSEVVLEGSNYTCSPTTLEYGDDRVRITYRDGDLSISTYVAVQVLRKPVDPGPGPDDPNPPTPPTPGPEPETPSNDGLSVGAKVGIGVGVPVGVLVCVAVAVIVVLVLKKKKANGNNDDTHKDNDVQDSQENADIAETIGTDEKAEHVEVVETLDTADTTENVEATDAVESATAEETAEEAETAETADVIDTEDSLDAGADELQNVGEENSQDDEITNDESTATHDTGDSDNE